MSHEQFQLLYWYIVSQVFVLLLINAAPGPGVPPPFLPSEISVSYRPPLRHKIRICMLKSLEVCPNYVVYMRNCEPRINFVPLIGMTL